MFPDRARVTRRGALPLEPGLQRIEFTDLPLPIQTDSLRAAGRGSAVAVLLGVEARKVFYSETPTEAIRELERQIEVLQQQDRTLLDQQAAAEVRLGFAKNLADKATEQLARGLAFGRADIAQSGTLIDFVQQQIERAQASSSQARDQLSKTTIYSPMDGTVTVLNSKLGERLVATNQFAGTDVMRVADLTHMQAVVDVNENDVVNVKLGDKANIKIDAYGDRKFKGVVQQIANTGKTTGTGTQEEVTNFEVKIRVDDHDVALRPGLSCTADIETNMVKDAVAVPMQSVTIRTGDTNFSPEEIEKQKQKVAARDKDDNKAELSNDRLEKQAQKEEREKLAKVVFVKNGNKAHMLKVTTGIADDSYMEIKSGIKPGDEVISGSYSAISRKLKEGAKVAYDKEAAK